LEATINKKGKRILVVSSDEAEYLLKIATQIPERIRRERTIRGLCSQMAIEETKNKPPI